MGSALIFQGTGQWLGFFSSSYVKLGQ